VDFATFSQPEVDAAEYRLYRSDDSSGIILALIVSTGARGETRLRRRTAAVAALVRIPGRL